MEKKQKTLLVASLIVLTLAVWSIWGYLSSPERAYECVLPGDCEGRPHANCTSDWLCIDNRCVWGCGECSLSLCDCNCYPSGETPEEKTGNLCGINCFGEYNVSGCEYRNGRCVETHVEANNSMPNPAAAYCEGLGYAYEIRTAPDGNQYGVCVFSDGSECDAWQFFGGGCAVYKTSPCTNLSVSNISDWAGISFEAGKDFIWTYQNLSYVCCANLTVSVERTDYEITITETNIGGMCRCICGYYVEVLVPGLLPGTYDVSVYGVAYEDMEPELLGSSSLAVGAECSRDEDCVPAQCCHPSSCVPSEYAPDCSGVACTEECRSGTLDCGCGRCACVEGVCGVEWDQSQDYC